MWHFENKFDWFPSGDEMNRMSSWRFIYCLRLSLCRLFGEQGVCSVCCKKILAFEMVMRARENVYHLECFSCQRCNQRFCVGDKFYLINNRILCVEDYEEMMAYNKKTDHKRYVR